MWPLFTSALLFTCPPTSAYSFRHSLGRRLEIESGQECVSSRILSPKRLFFRRAFQSGFEPDTVMCQAIQTDMVNCAANWASCGEWCLTKSSGSCPQIHATVRRNGTDVLFENCTRSVVTHCPQVSSECAVVARQSASYLTKRELVESWTVYV